MKALALLILSVFLGCCLAYTIVERPANVDEQQFDRVTSDVDQTRHAGLWFQQHPYNLPKPEPQALFELYYLIQVITIYRRQHPRAHRSHLDALIEELQDEDFQLKIRQALQGVQELEVLKAYTELNLQDYAPFVNDRRQLIPAIHRTLSEIQLSSIKDKELRWTLERLREESTAMTVKMARKEAEVLRELIESNRKQEKVWTIADILAAVFGKQDENTMKDFEQKYEVVDDGKPVDDGKVEEFWVVIEDDKKEETTTKVTPVSTSVEPFQFIDENYEQYEAKQEVETEVEVEQSAEESSEAKQVEDAAEEDAVEQSVEQEEAKTVDEEEAIEESVEQSSVVEREEAVDEEEVVESLEQESTDDLDDEQRIETDGFEFKDENYERSEPEAEDFERTVPEEDDQSYVEETVAEEELPDAVPEELQTLEAEQEYTDEAEEEPQTLDASVEAVADPEPEPEYTEEFEDEPLDAVKSQEQPEAEYTEELVEDLESPVDPEQQPEQEFSEELTEDIPEPAAAKTDSITFPEDPQWVEDSVRPVGSSAATSLDSTPPKDEYSSEQLPSSMEDVQPEAPVAQSVPLWISKGYTTEYEGREAVEGEAVQETELSSNDLESRAEPVETAQIDPETLQYVAFEILKVVSLLEDNAGFVGLRDQITSEDVDRLIEQLSMAEFVELINERGIDRVQMINALERLIVEKNLENTGEIVDVLEQWKKGEDGRIMEEEAQEEARVDGAEVEAEAELKSNDLEGETESVDDGYFSENYGKSGGDEDEIEGRMLEEDDGETSARSEQELVNEVESDVEVDGSDGAVEEVEAEPEMKSNDLLEETESVDDGYFSEAYGKAGGDEDVIEGRMLEEDDVATSIEDTAASSDEQLQTEDSDDQVEAKSEDVQEMRSNDLIEEVQSVDDGYFSETYGNNEDEVEGRTLEEEQIVATQDEAQDAEQLVDELEGELKVDAELQVDSVNTLDEAAEESNSVQELKSSDLVEEAELLNDSPELLEDAGDLSESITKVESLEDADFKILQPLPEEVTEDTEPLEDVQRVVEEKKLQPFPEEVTEDTVPADQFDAKMLEPFPEQTLNEAKPLEIAVEDQIDPDQIMNETLQDQDNPKIVPISKRPFLETSAGGSEPLEVARAGTDEGDEDRREEILEGQHPEP